MGRTRPYKEAKAEMRAKRDARDKARGMGRGSDRLRTALVEARAEAAAPLPPVGPTPGRIVLVHRTTGQPVPAIVTHVHATALELEEGQIGMPDVSLVVFDAMNGENALPSESLRWVRYGTQPGQWSWPPRVG